MRVKLIKLDLAIQSEYSILNIFPIPYKDTNANRQQRTTSKQETEWKTP